MFVCLFAWLRRLWTIVVLHGEDGIYIMMIFLTKCQKRAARVILQYAFLTPSADMFSELNWLSFSERVKYRKATLVFKCVNRMTPRHMTHLFTPLTQIRETRRSTRMARFILQERIATPRVLLCVVQLYGMTCIYYYEQ